MSCVYSGVDTGRIVLDAPPAPPAQNSTNVLARLMPVAMVAAMGGMTVLYLTSTDATSRNPMFLFFPAMMAISLIGTLAYGGRGAGRAGELAAQRAEYLRYLDAVDGALARAGEEQHRHLHATHPGPGMLWSLAGTHRLWERTEDHPDFGLVRVGIGEQACATSVTAPGPAASADADPVTADAVQRLLTHRAMVRDVPVTVSLRAVRTISICGEPAAARSVARALLCQIATLHDPTLVAVSAPRGADWDWVKWCANEWDSRTVHHRVVLSEETAAAETATTSIICVTGTGPPVVSADGVPVAAVCDEMSSAEAAACARRIARHRPHRCGRSPALRDWPALMGFEDPDALDVARQWSRDPGQGLLRVPIGVAEDGSVVELDIKEAAADGMGPHGLCVGATGSGKSEFLRTLVLGMICTHPPELLNLVLVDFKGGATFLGLEGVHHVSAVITNLADEAPLVSRMRDALSGEINRRQETLRAAGNLTNITQYAQARAGDDTLAPLPALVVIVDEFSELLSRHPDFSEVFVAIGRLGRSLGIHLLLATQRLDEGRLRGLETHLSYRVCLKTFSAAESRAVLGVPDAYDLSSRPGAAYLKTASGVLTRFQTAYVSGGYTPRPRPRSRPLTVRPFTRTGDTEPERAVPQRPLLDAMLTRLVGHGAPAHRVWLPPLRSSPRLAELLAGATFPRLRVPIGVVDCPFEQQQRHHVIDLSAAAGNVAVVGAPRSGKSTALCTLMAGLAAVHDAASVQFYCLDFGGGDVTAMRDLPHLGTVASRHEGDLCRRIVAHVESILQQRESATGRDDRGDVFLVVDGWATLRQEFDLLEPRITALAGRGLAYGVHVMIAASRWADLRPALKDQIGTRVELRLGDPAESEMDRRRSRDLADRPPGRALTREGRESAIALTDDRVPVRRGDAVAPPVELLPDRVARADLEVDVPGSGEVVLGLRERDLSPAVLDLAEHAHLLILGENQCGKTALLRLICTELIAAGRDSRLDIIDFRRTLLGVVETDHLAGYAVTPAAAGARMASLAGILTARMPDEHVTQQQLRERSWWRGPEIFVIIDDYDLVAGATGNPLAPLAEFLPYAGDLGLHVVVARRSGGAARAMFDPLLTRMRDMGCAGVMMSSTPEDGVLLGTVRPARLPPGRGTLIARGRPDEAIQVAWVDPP